MLAAPDECNSTITFSSALYVLDAVAKKSLNTIVMRFETTFEMFAANHGARAGKWRHSMNTLREQTEYTYSVCGSNIDLAVGDHRRDELIVSTKMIPSGRRLIAVI